VSDAPPCIFCHAEDRILVANALAFATRDAAPVSPGHTLVVPRRHCETPFELTPDEVAACFALLRDVRAGLLASAHPPDGFNVGVNVGAAGGQGVAHVHVHVIPRYAGDVPDPRGGIRNILPFRHRAHDA
jgi:diadenosine tetraphosphate (Ap4A) HIT family hydrolase